MAAHQIFNGVQVGSVILIDVLFARLFVFSSARLIVLTPCGGVARQGF
jgi:hypothetical protein